MFRQGRWLGRARRWERFPTNRKAVIILVIIVAAILLVLLIIYAANLTSGYKPY